jgi:hypothetical protein
MRTSARGALVGAGVISLLAWGPAADAAIVLTDTDSWTEDYVNVCSYDDIGDVTINTHQEFDQVYTLKRRAAGTDQYFFSAVLRIAETNTNPDTGRSWTVSTVIREHDTNVLDVDEDVFTVRTMIHFRSTYNDEAGEPFDRSSGTARQKLQVDTQGTLDPEDDEGSFLEFDFFHGSPGPDFCEDARNFTVD